MNSRAIQSNIALYYLAEYGSAKNPEVDFICLESSINQPATQQLAEILAYSPDLLAISCYIWNIEATSRLCSDLKKVAPDLKILLGGHEVSHDPKTYIEKGICDFVITGEGEIPFAKFIRHLQGFANIEDVDSLVYRVSNQVISNPKAAELQPLDSIPSPYKGNLLERPFIYYEVSRGCVYKCHFCLSALDRGTRFFSMERFHKDMEIILSSSRVKQVKFVDRTFNLNLKRTNQIFKYLKDNGLGRNFHFEIQAELFKPSTLKLLESIPEGQFQFEIGIQSIHQKTLDLNGRSCRLDKLEKNLDYILQFTKVHVHLDLIVGLEGESPEMFIQSFNWAFGKRAHHLQIETLKILKGSLSRKYRESKDIVFQDSPPYSLLKTDLWSFSQIRQVEDIAALLEIFWNREVLREAFWQLSKNFQSPWIFLEKLSNYFKREQLPLTGLAMKRAYEALYGFGCEYLKANNPFFETLILDYLEHFQSQGKTPFPKTSSTLKPPQYSQLVKVLKLQSKGFIEVFDNPLNFRGQKGRYFYFGGKNEPVCKNIDLQLSELPRDFKSKIGLQA